MKNSKVQAYELYFIEFQHALYAKQIIFGDIYIYFEIFASVLMIWNPKIYLRSPAAQIPLIERNCQLWTRRRPSRNGHRMRMRSVRHSAS